MFIKNLSIGKKIAAAFSIIAVINIAFGIFLSTELNTVKSELLNYTEDTLPAMEKVDAVRDKISYWRRTQFAVFAMNDENQIRQTITRNESIRREIETELAAYGKSIWPGEEEQTYNRLMSLWNGYLNTMDKFNDALLAGDKDAAYPILTNSLSTFESIETEVNKIGDDSQRRNGQQQESNSVVC
ncbi:MCP four helix bundle domain-containing protein [Vibrio vulnificus]|nr:MCP four helix bundle domain-containing protein [Vibrio vulnificus]